MRTIYSHPKKAFQGMAGVSKWEISMFSMILSFLGMAVYSQLKRIYAAGKAADGGPKLSSGLVPIEFLALIVSIGILYLAGVTFAKMFVKNHNARMNEQIDAARSAVQSETGLELDHMDMSFFISMAAGGITKEHTDKVDDTEHTLTFSGIGEAVVISCSSVVQRKSAPALRLAMGNLG